MGDRIDALNTQKNEADEAFNNLILTLPNLAHASVPVGPDESANEEIKVHGDKPAFVQAKGHVDLCDALGLIDFEQAPNCRRRLFALHRLGRAPGTGDDPVSAGPARARARLYRSEPAVHRAGRVHGGLGQFPKFLDQAYVQEGLDGETLGKRYLIPSQALWQTCIAGDFERNGFAEILLRLQPVFPRGSWCGRR